MKKPLFVGPFIVFQEEMERAAGFEPVTFSLGNGFQIRNINDFSGLGCSILSNRAKLWGNSAPYMHPNGGIFSTSC